MSNVISIQFGGNQTQLKTKNQAKENKDTLTYSNKKTLKRYASLIRSGGVETWTKSDISGFKKLVSSAQYGWRKNTAYHDAILELWGEFQTEVLIRNITKEQSDIGL